MLMKWKKLKKKSGSLFIFSGMLLAGLGFLLFSGSHHAYASAYTASTGFSSTQGANQWYYQQRAIGTSTYTSDTYSAGAWYGSGGGYVAASSLHPDNSYDAVRKWVAPSTGIISITGTAKKLETGGGNGVIVSVLQNSTSLWSQTIAYNDTTGYSTDASLGNVSVTAGDAIYFIVNNNGDYAYDGTTWDPTITYVTSWTASTGFSSTQGKNQWTYQQRAIGTGTYTNMTTYSAGAWYGSSSAYIASNNSHPDNSYDTVRKWVAPLTGAISITGRAYKQETGGGNGVVVSVLQNSTSLWSRTIAYNDTTGYTTDASLGSIAVTAGDAIYFIVNNNGDYAYDGTIWDPAITYASVSSWKASTGFSSTQGQNQWYYQQLAIGTNSYANMIYSGSSWNGTGSAYIAASSFHPDNSYDAVRKWVAPATGTVSITGTAKKYDVGGGNGVVVKVKQNNTTIWTRTLAYNDSTGYSTDAFLSSVAVTAGDAIYFTVNNNGEYSYDATTWDPTVTYIAGSAPVWNLNTDDTNLTLTVSGNQPAISLLKNPKQGWNWALSTAIVPLVNKVNLGGAAPWKASTGFSYTRPQGTNQWYYQQRSVGTGTYTNMTYNTISDYWAGSAGANMFPGSSQPDNSYDTARKWVAPTTGTISIKGRAYMQNVVSPCGDGVIVSVLKNSTSIWTQTIAYNDGTGYSTDASLGSVAVTAGDAIYFIVNKNANNSCDAVNWDPTIAYATTAYHPDWIYQSAAVDTTSGTKVTLTFTSTTPNLTLKSTWWARPGAGPVEQSTTIQNDSGSNITYQYSDVVSADFTVATDNDVTLSRFDRSSYRDIAADPGFDTGVFNTVMGANSDIQSTVSNQYSTGAFVLPYEMLNVGTAHGLYLGYYWDFGRMNNTTYGNAHIVRNTFYLQDSGSATLGTGSGNLFKVPGMLFGTYQGDIDTGSNAMKRWFWNYKITPTLKANTNEPVVEYSVGSNDRAGITAELNKYPLASWGVQQIKLDYLWTDDGNPNPIGGFGPTTGFLSNDMFYGWDWTANNVEWSAAGGGMNLGTLAHSYSLKNSLYFANRYNHADLNTTAGQTSEENALQALFNTGYDYYRSDMEFEPTNDYMSHQGFLNVLDYMIANNGNFRWENCSAGGSKKSFDFMERMSSVATEDSVLAAGTVENYRKAFYANSYMIPAVQLKDDNIDLAELGTTPQAYSYSLRTDIMGSFSFADLTAPGLNMPTTEFELFRRYIQLYTNYQRPIIRGGDVYHILPIADGVHWDGMEFFNTALNKGSVFLFKPGSDAAAGTTKTIFFKGLDPGATYTLNFQDRPAQNTTATGATLMNTGLTVTGMTGLYASETIWINTGTSGNGLSTGTAYKLTNRSSGKAMGILSNNTADNAQGNQYTYGPTASQSWTLEDVGQGMYRIKNNNSGKYLGIAGESESANAIAVQNPWTAGKTQYWFIDSLGSGYFRIVNSYSGLVLQPTGSANDNLIEQEPWNSANNLQYWTIN